MPKTPDKTAEQAAAENIQGTKHEPGLSKVPESDAEAVELAKDIMGTRCKDPDDGSPTDRAWVGWADDGPRVYVRVHDASIQELRELKQYGFEKHKNGNFLWRNDGPFDVWESIEDEISEQGQQWSTDDWQGE